MLVTEKVNNKMNDTDLDHKISVRIRKLSKLLFYSLLHLYNENNFKIIRIWEGVEIWFSSRALVYHV